jgi:hypothetical protein
MYSDIDKQQLEIGLMSTHPAIADCMAGYYGHNMMHKWWASKPANKEL